MHNSLSLLVSSDRYVCFFKKFDIFFEKFAHVQLRRMLPEAIFFQGIQNRTSLAVGKAAVSAQVAGGAASPCARKPPNLHASLSPTRTTAAPARAEHAGLAAYDPAVPGPARS